MRIMNLCTKKRFVCFSMEAYRRFLSLTCLMILTLVFQIGFSSADDFRHDFISIDCGAEEGFTDDEHGVIYYDTDEKFITTGINKIVPAINGTSDDLFLLAGTNFSRLMTSSRVFEDGGRNCYALNPKQGKKSKYLVRASFRYGNYDRKNQIPQFDLYISGNLWTTVVANDSNPNNYVFHEIIYRPSDDLFKVCLVDTGKGTPFISALELRPITNSSIYEISDPGKVLRACFRYDMGYGPGNHMYADDPYDRIWSQYGGDTLNNWYMLPDTLIAEDSYSIPQKVLQTMSQAPNNRTCIDVWWHHVNRSSAYHVYFHFAELEEDNHQNRKSSISVNDVPKLEIRHNYQYSATIHLSISGAEISTDSLKLSVCPTPNPADHNKTYPAILNAIELYEELSLPVGAADYGNLGNRRVLVPITVSVLIAIGSFIALII